MGLKFSDPILWQTGIGPKQSATLVPAEYVEKKTHLHQIRVWASDHFVYKCVPLKNIRRIQWALPMTRVMVEKSGEDQAPQGQKRTRAAAGQEDGKTGDGSRINQPGVCRILTKEGHPPKEIRRPR